MKYTFFIFNLMLMSTIWSSERPHIKYSFPSDLSCLNTPENLNQIRLIQALESAFVEEVSYNFPPLDSQKQNTQQDGLGAFVNYYLLSGDNFVMSTRILSSQDVPGSKDVKIFRFPEANCIVSISRKSFPKTFAAWDALTRS